MNYPDGIFPELARQVWGPDTPAEAIAIETQIVADEIACLSHDELSDIGVLLERVADDEHDPCHRDRRYLQKIEAQLAVVRAAIAGLRKLV